MSITPRLRLAIILPAVLTFAGLASFFGLRKTITLEIDGQSTGLTTYAFTVGSLLHQQGIHLATEDILTPASGAWLKNGDKITLQRAIPVQLLAGRKLISFISSARNLRSLVAHAGITLQPGDQVLSNGQLINLDQNFPLNAKAISLQIIPSRTITITADGETKEIGSASPTVGSALWAAGFRLFAADSLRPSMDAPLTPGLSVNLQRSRLATIYTKAGDLILRTSATTVGGALVDANVSLQGLDYSLPPPGEAIPPNGQIKVVRVSEQVLVELSPMKFETKYEPVNDLQLDSQSIVQEGEYGLVAQGVRIRYEDGQEITRTVEGEWMARDPVPRIIGYGTLVTMQTEVVDGVEIQYWRKLNMYATSYHPSEVGGTTASGLPLQKGVAAIDINYIPFGTQMYVPGYGEVVAADIGGGVAGRWIDLGYSDNDYVAWHQWVTVYFLWPPPDNIVWIVP